MAGSPKLIAGNWKMNGLSAALSEAQAMAAGSPQLPPHITLAICPPATLLSKLAETLQGSSIKTGGQDCHTASSGAHTGDISTEMLADLGATYVIVGHSERRTDHGESDQTVADKASAAFRSGLIPIICVGEQLSQRDAGNAVSVVQGQVAASVPDEAKEKPFVIAYEPVWAIGTGRTPTVEQVEEVHSAIRAAIVERFGPEQASTPLLYGGSVKPGNAAELMHARNVDGALVGGASLKADDFLAIASAST